MSRHRPGSFTKLVVLVVVVVLGQASGAGADDGPSSIHVAGTVSAPATRGPSATAAAQCDLALIGALAARHPEAGQWIVTTSDTFAATSGSVQVAVRVAGRWACQRGPQPAMLGRAGARPLTERRSGDDTTPAGVFPLGTATAWDGETFQFFGNDDDPGVRGAHRAVRAGDCWGATPGTSTYNHLFRADLSRCTGDDEYLPAITGAYAHAALIGANGEPSVSGDAPGEPAYAAAIFLHRHAYSGTSPKATSGCVSLALDDLVATLRLIDPARAPRFAIGPLEWLLTEA